MKIEGDTVILSTGREMYAHGGIIGLGPDCSYPDQLVASYGYDGGLEEDFTPEERQEIAEYMINLWKKWAMT